MEWVRLADAPRFTVLRRVKNVPDGSRTFVFWGGCYIPGRVNDVPHGVCFDLFGAPVHIRLTDRVIPNATSKGYQERMRDWYWDMMVYEPVHWMRVVKEETNPLLLRIQARKARKTSGLIRVARKRAS